MIKIFPSLISSDLLQIKQTLELLDPLVEGYHLDIMDFHFVPNLTWGPAFVNAIRAATKKQLFVHLMVDNPEQYFDLFSLQEDDIVSFHYESPSGYTPEELTTQISSRGWIPSIALNPETPLEVIFSLTNLQHLLLMSVNPGFSGQTFITSTLEKLVQSATIRSQRNKPFTIAVDGGINENNCYELASSGADELAIATAIFKDPSPSQALLRLRKACNNQL
ncbi:ribulose-phosphate 3-epimerase [Candidatus Dependentiae bacterium]|nr:ribulose-phosphate 3-epimerase [Candidatus Dependentiae bacterium]